MQRQNIYSSALSFTAGYVDTLGFIALFGLFTAHVTGNLVLIGSELIQPSHGVLLKLLAFPAFIAGVMAAKIIADWKTGNAALNPMLYLQAIFLLVFMLAGSFAYPIQHADSAPALVAGLAGTFAMGIQNGASRLLLASLVPTTVMTGNVTQLVIDSMEVWKNGTKEAKTRIQRFWPAVLLFAVGATGGTLMYVFCGFWALGVPVLVLLALSRVPFQNANDANAAKA